MPSPLIGANTRGLNLHHKSWIWGIITVIIISITIVPRSCRIPAMLYCTILKSSLQFLKLYHPGIALPMQHHCFLLRLSDMQLSLSMLETNAIRSWEKKFLKNPVLIPILPSAPSVTPMAAASLRGWVTELNGDCPKPTGLQACTRLHTHSINQVSQSQPSEDLSEILWTRTGHHSSWKCNTFLSFFFSFSFPCQKVYLYILTRK